MAVPQIMLLVATATLALGQRPFFAGSRPIGYPELPTTTSAGGLGNRFGDGDNSTVPASTERLPVEANGDRELVNRLSKLPIDQQPFWFINWQALEANRRNPQTYPLRPSQFAEPLSPSAVVASPNFPPANNVGNVNSNSGSANRNSGNVNPTPANVNTDVSNGAGPLGNRFSDVYTNSGNENKGYVSSASDNTKSEKLSKPDENTRDVVVPGINRAGSPLEDTLFNSEPNGRLDSANFNANSEGSSLGNLNSNNKGSVNAGTKSDKDSENKKDVLIPFLGRQGTVYREDVKDDKKEEATNPLKDTVFNNEPNRPQLQPTKHSNSGSAGLHQLHSSGPGYRYSHEHDHDFKQPSRSKYDSSEQDPKDFHYDYYF